MEFGKIDELEIGRVNFALPPDTPFTSFTLNGQREASPAIYVGCAKWGRPDWVGKVYPPKVKQKDYLTYYAEYFNCIELNAFFYRIFPADVVAGWASQAGESFKFCPKVTNIVTHMKRLKDAMGTMNQFVYSVRHFGAKLGTCFLQLPPNFNCSSKDNLINFLSELEPSFKIAVEFRHPDWFTEREDVQETFAFLHTRGIGTVITDASGRRDCIHQTLTNKVAFIRFVGNNLHPTDFTRIDEWVQTVSRWLGSGLTEVYFFIHNSDEVNSPVLCKYAIEKFSTLPGARLKTPTFLSEN